MKKVIDVSKWNAITNFEILTQNIDGVIIRAGYRGANGNADLYTDSRFNPYAIELSKYNTHLGAYFTTSAITTAEAVEEAKYFISLVKASGVEFKLPLFVNSDWVTSNHKGRSDLIKDENLRTEIILAFIEECKNQGYECGIFMSDEWLTTKVIEYKLTEVKKLLTRIINTTTKYSNTLGDRSKEPYTIKGIAGLINQTKWYDDSYFVVPEPVVVETPAPKKKGRKLFAASAPVVEEPKTETTTVEEPKVETKSTTKKKEYKAGNLIRLKEQPVYKTSIASTVIDTVSGRFYIYNNKILNGRIRIADKKVNGELLGWIEIDTEK